MSQINVGTVNASIGINLPKYTVAQRPSPSTPGQQIYDPDDGFIYVADGAQWVKVGGGRAANGLSSDTAATNVSEIVNAGATSDGVYWYQDASGGTKYQAYTKLSSPIDGAPWVLAFNINTNSANSSIGGIPHWDNTTFWLTRNEQQQANTSPWGSNVKTRAFDQYPVQEILFMCHKRQGFQNNSAQLNGYGIYVNNNYSGNSLYQIFTTGNNLTLSSGGRKTYQDYSNLLNWNNNRPQILGGDMFISGTINGRDNSSYNLMFNVTNNFNSSNYANARVSFSGAAGNGNYGYTAGGLGVKHGHNNNWGGYAAYDKISAYCSGTEIYGSNSSGVNYQSGINPNFYPNCMGRYNGVVNYNMAVWVR